MPRWRTAQMVLLAPRGTVPMTRLRGRSLDMMVAGTLASRLHGAPCSRPKPATAGRDGRVGDDAAISMRYVQARTVARRDSCQRQLDRQECNRRSNPRQTAPCSVDYKENAFLLKIYVGFTGLSTRCFRTEDVR